ncbi:MAG: carbohydrate ABC transporter permease [Oscillospiraceae bacterium]|nr:carbohydrate ABC transporter permease [Oscillospiraceae bacterium]
MSGMTKPIRGSLHSKKRNKLLADVFSFITIVIIAAVIILPMYWMFRSSVMGSLDIFKAPPDFLPMGTINPLEWLWRNYAEVANSTAFNYFQFLLNSLTISVPCVVFGTATAISCAYAFARLRFKGKGFLFSLCVGSMLLPTMVTLIPLYIAWSYLGFVDSYVPLILPYLCGGGAFNIFLLRQFIKSIPRELDEAAKIDGAGYFRTLVSVIVPSIKPAIIVVALLIFITTWNDLLQQMVYIQSREQYTLVLGLTVFFSMFKADYAGIFAATILTFIPGLLVYLFGQRYFVEGIVMTGMKN